MKNIKQQAVERKAQRARITAAKKEHDARVKAAKKEKARAKTTAKNFYKVNISHNMSESSIKVTSKKVAKTLEANKKRLENVRKERDKLDKKIKNARARGNFVYKKDLKKLQALRTRVRKEQASFNSKMYSLNEKAIVTTTYKNKNNKKVARTIIHQGNSDTLLKSGESGYARVKLLVPYVTKSDVEHGIGEYVTVMVEPHPDKLNIEQIVEIQLKPLKSGEDFEITHVSVSKTKRFN